MRNTGLLGDTDGFAAERMARLRETRGKISLCSLWRWN